MCFEGHCDVMTVQLPQYFADVNSQDLSKPLGLQYSSVDTEQDLLQILCTESNEKLTTRIKRIERFHESFNNHFGDKFELNTKVQISLNRTRQMQKLAKEILANRRLMHGKKQ